MPRERWHAVYVQLITVQQSEAFQYLLTDAGYTARAFPIDPVKPSSHSPRRRDLWVTLALLPLAHITQIVSLLYKLHVVLEVSDVLAGDANASRPC